MSVPLKNTTWLLLLVVALAQTAALAVMVIDRVQLVRNGREVVLPTVPVDPRSLFRGDYARLGYAIARVPAANIPEGQRKHGALVYVTLARASDAAPWTAVAANLEPPQQLQSGQLLLQGRMGWHDARATEINVRYGIESYFVPEGKGLELEKLVLDKKIGAIIAVDAKGRAAIKGLSVDDKRIYDEPLF